MTGVAGAVSRLINRTPLGPALRSAASVQASLDKYEDYRLETLFSTGSDDVRASETRCDVLPQWDETYAEVHDGCETLLFSHAS